MPGAPRPRVIPAEGEFRPCVSCEMLFDEVNRAIQAKGIPAWVRAVVLNVEGHGVVIQHKHSRPSAIALA